MTMVEPFFTLLTPAEQELARVRYGSDYRRYAQWIAGSVLLFSIFGVVSSINTLRVMPRISAQLSLLTALLLSGEQIYRLVRFPRGPAGSMLGFLVRPFVRKYLK